MKISLLIVALFSLVLVFIVALFHNESRNTFVKSTTQTVTTAAVAARDCLQLHGEGVPFGAMVACVEALERDPHVLALGIARSKSVADAYGTQSLLRRRADALDRLAMAEGKTRHRFDEKSGRLAVSVPFVATETGGCLKCHDAEEGEALGSFGLVYDLSGALEALKPATLKAAALAAALLLATLALFWLAVRPYRRFLARLSASLRRVDAGDFGHPVRPSDFKGELREAALRYDRVLEIFKNSVGSIVKRFNLLIRNLDIQAGHPLERASKALGLLANVYRFRYAVERDRSIFGLYEEIVKIVRDVTHAEHFSLYSVDRKERIKTLIYSTAAAEGEEIGETDALLERLDIDEVGFEFPSMAETKGSEIAFYFCMPIDIDEYVTLIVALFARNRKELDHYRETVMELRYYLENIKPVIESKILTQKLREQSLLDGLTGLYNRKFLEEFIDKIDNQAKRSQTRYAVLMLDIDFFKKVNDTYGHDVGDKFIRLLGRIIQDHIRASDIAVRYGGEEFLVLLHESSHAGAVKVAETIRRDFSKRVIHTKGVAIRKSVSIGISFYPDHTVTSLREGIKYADIALYRAKAQGRDCIVIFSDEMLAKES